MGRDYRAVTPPAEVLADLAPGRLRIFPCEPHGQHPWLAERTSFAVRSQLRRLDFSCASAFANLLNEQLEEGKTVRLLRPNSLVAAFLDTLSLNPEITVVPARHAA